VASPPGSDKRKLFEGNQIDAQVFWRKGDGDLFNEIYLRYPKDRGLKADPERNCQFTRKGITPKDRPLEDVKEAEAHKTLF
jgi:hypothetical protein